MFCVFYCFVCVLFFLGGRVVFFVCCSQFFLLVLHLLVQIEAAKQEDTDATFTLLFCFSLFYCTLESFFGFVQRLCWGSEWSLACVV